MRGVLVSGSQISPPPGTQIARTNSVPAVVAQRLVGPVFLHFPPPHGFRQEPWFDGNCGAIGRLVRDFVLLRHRDRARCNQYRGENKNRELAHLCPPSLRGDRRRYARADQCAPTRPPRGASREAPSRSSIDERASGIGQISGLSEEAARLVTPRDRETRRCFAP